ncbi:MAG: orotate phosphoribosyltransferase [Planctomycetota bacterium]
MSATGSEADGMPMTREQVAKRIAEVALLRGEFTLRSGRKSSYYLDKYLFTTEPEVLEALGELFGEVIDRIEDDRAEAGESPIDRLAGAELGGIPLVTVAALFTGFPAVLVRNQKKDYGTSKQLEGKLAQGDTVVFVEDVATSGGQALEAARTLEAAGANVAAILCTVDRQEGAREAIENAGFRFEALFTKTDLGINE